MQTDTNSDTYPAPSIVYRWRMADRVRPTLEVDLGARLSEHVEHTYVYVPTETFLRWLAEPQRHAPADLREVLTGQLLERVRRMVLRALAAREEQEKQRA